MAESKARLRAAHKSYARHREQILAQKRSYYQEHRERLLAKAREYRSDPEKHQRYLAAIKRWNKKNSKKRYQSQKRWFAANPWKRREYRIRHDYGIDKASWDKMMDEQHHACPICGASLSDVADGVNGTGKIAVDHVKGTKIVRGILCGICNRGIGCLKHDLARLRKALAYLERAERLSEMA